MCVKFPLKIICLFIFLKRRDDEDKENKEDGQMNGEAENTEVRELDRQKEGLELPVIIEIVGSSLVPAIKR